MSFAGEVGGEVWWRADGDDEGNRRRWLWRWRVAGIPCGFCPMDSARRLARAGGVFAHLAEEGDFGDGLGGVGQVEGADVEGGGIFEEVIEEVGEEFGIIGFALGLGILEAFGPGLGEGGLEV